MNEAIPALVSETSSPVLARLDEAWRALEAAQTLQEVVPLVRGAELLREYARQVRADARVMNEAARFKVESSAKAGEMLNKRPKNPGAATALDDLRSLPTLDNLGVSFFESHYWQKIAAVPGQKRHEFYLLVAANVDRAETTGPGDPKPEPQEVTTAGTLRYHHERRLEVHHSSEEDEWLTPPEIIAATLDVLGAIDVDPCGGRSGRCQVSRAPEVHERAGR